MQNRIQHLKTVDSTNNYARKVLENEGVNNGHVILADFQRCGRGQGENEWVSQRGKNLLASYIWKPSRFLAENQFFSSMALSLSVCGMLREKGLHPVIKWPNDILVNEKKICGILIEHILMGKYILSSILGFGVNINQTVFDSALNATSVAIETGNISDVKVMMDVILKKLNTILDEVILGGTDLIKDRYLDQLYMFKTEKTFNTNKGVLTGRIIDVKNTGELVICDLHQHCHEFIHQEVSYI